VQKSRLAKILHGLLFGCIASLCIIVISVFVLPDLFQNFEAKSYDWRYEQRVKRLQKERGDEPIEEIIIVDIDDRSLEKLGRFEQWPRSYHADLIDYIASGGAMSIGFDILFLEPDKDPRLDARLLQATRQSGILSHSLAFSMANPDAFLYPMDAPPPGLQSDKFSLSIPREKAAYFFEFERLDGQLLDLYNASANAGFANFFPERDGIIRKMPLFINFAGKQYPSLSLAIVLSIFGKDSLKIEYPKDNLLVLRSANISNGGEITIPVDRNSRLLVNYQGSFRTFRYVSYYDVLEHRLPKEMFEGRIVLVGTSAAGLSDLRPVPFQNAFPGVEIHATVIHNILTGQFVRQIGLLPSLLVTGLLAIVIAILAMLFKPWQCAVAGFLLSGGYAVFVFYQFIQNGVWIDLIRPVLAMFFAFLFVFVYRYVDEERNKRYIKNMFQHYLTSSVVNELLKHPDMLKLGGERRIATAFFSDIKSFTTVSEALPPEELVAQLNDYLSAMTEIVLKYDGYLDKYEGDAIMAIFGVPVDQTDHAERACTAALEMQETLVGLRKRWQMLGRPLFHVRIGINSGAMVAGNIGGENRFDYTVIGDAVNLASRLEGANKVYDTSIMISEFTRELLGDKFVLRELDLIRVKGKIKPVRVYELVAKSRTALSNTQLLVLDEYEHGLAEYKKRNWDQAVSHFDKALLVEPQDGPSKFYVERCEYFKTHPLPDDWDGVFEMKTK
jgi:adenylate cyclase